MLKKILSTVFSKILIGFLNLAILIINSKYFGSQGLGVISLIVLAISFYVLLNGIIGGGTFMYFVPRINTSNLFIISYLWAIFSFFVFFIILNTITLVPPEYIFHVLFVSIIFSLTNVNLQIIAGKKKLNIYNLINSIQYLLLFLSLLIFFYFANNNNLINYIYSLYISYSITYILSLFYTRQYLKSINLSSLYSDFKQVFILGIQNFFAAVTQKLNYRLSYYFIERMLNLKQLGHYSAGVQLSESTWILGRSLSFVQYSESVNINEPQKKEFLTVLLVKLSFIISVSAILVLLLIPDNFFVFLLGKDFSQIHDIISALAPGIITLSCSFIFSSYFSAVGKPRFNTFSSVAGLIVTAGSGYFLISNFGITGAGILASLSYTVSTVYQFVIFIKISNTKIGDFLINKNDFVLFKKLIHESFKRLH